MLDERVRRQIEMEIREIDELFCKYADLFQHAKNTKPDLTQTTALASVLHSFYSGIENIFLRIVKNADHITPTGNKWHHSLLAQMSKQTASRSAVLSERAREQLQGYLGFRHFYRHAYSHFLEWSQMKQLVFQAEDVWTEIRDEIQKFLERE